MTSPQAFDGLSRRGLRALRPRRTRLFSRPQYSGQNQDKPIADPVSRNQVETLNRNAAEFGLDIFGIGHERNGIIHVIGPENGLTLLATRIVKVRRQPYFHSWRFWRGGLRDRYPEVEMVFASAVHTQPKPKSMRITVDGHLRPGVTAKDVALYIISRMTIIRRHGIFPVEYAGEVVRDMSMEERMTLGNLSIEIGRWRGGMVAPDETTFAYLKGRDFAPKDDKWDEAVHIGALSLRMMMPFSMPR